jgi:hypothetical protein
VLQIHQGLLLIHRALPRKLKLCHHVRRMAKVCRVVLWCSVSYVTNLNLCLYELHVI